MVVVERRGRQLFDADTTWCVCSHCPRHQARKLEAIVPVFAQNGPIEEKYWVSADVEEFAHVSHLVRELKKTIWGAMLARKSLHLINIQA
jgi:hypothetical protein